MKIFTQHLQKSNTLKKWNENIVTDIDDAFYLMKLLTNKNLKQLNKQIDYETNILKGNMDETFCCYLQYQYRDDTEKSKIQATHQKKYSNLYVAIIKKKNE